MKSCPSARRRRRRCTLFFRCRFLGIVLGILCIGVGELHIGLLDLRLQPAVLGVEVRDEALPSLDGGVQVLSPGSMEVGPGLACFQQGCLRVPMLRDSFVKLRSRSLVVEASLASVCNSGSSFFFTTEPISCSFALACAAGVGGAEGAAVLGVDGQGGGS